MKLLARYLRIYALNDAFATTPQSHPDSPIEIPAFPTPGLHSTVLVGAVPDEIVDVLKQHYAFMERLPAAFGLPAPPPLPNLEAFRREAGNVPASAVLVDRRPNHSLPPSFWYVTIYIDNHIDLPEDRTGLLGILTHSWISLDEDGRFFEKHAEILDELAVKVAILVKPYRYRCLIWDRPVIYLPIGIALSPTRFCFGGACVFASPPLETVPISSLSSGSIRPNNSLSLAVHFYLRATIETDRMSCFFDAFRGLETLGTSLPRKLRSKTKSRASSDPSFKTSKRAEKQFRILALALNPTEATRDFNRFQRLNDWRDDLAHGNRKLRADDAPDEDAFELLHRYISLRMLIT